MEPNSSNFPKINFSFPKFNLSKRWKIILAIPALIISVFILFFAFNIILTSIQPSLGTINVPVPFYQLIGKVKSLEADSFILEVDQNRFDPKYISSSDRKIIFDKNTIFGQLIGVNETRTKNIFKDVTIKEIKKGDMVAIYSSKEINQAPIINANRIERLTIP